MAPNTEVELVLTLLADVVVVAVVVVAIGLSVDATGATNYIANFNE